MEQTYIENELVIKNHVNVGTIEHNFAELKKRAQQMVQPYMGQILTQDTVKDGKSMLADLRKLKTGLDNERKNIKSQWMAPYNEFERLAKEVIAVVDVPIQEIDTQVKQFEEAEQQLKMADIDELKAKLIGESSIADFLYTINWFDNPKWKNKTVTMKSIEDEIISKIEAISGDIEIIRTTCGEFTDSIIVDYGRTGDVRTAIKLKDRLAEQKAQEEKRKEQIIEEQRIRKAQEEALRIEREKKAFDRIPITEPVNVQETVQAKEPPQATEETPEERTFTFNITTSKENLIKLLQFCRENEIKFQKVVNNEN